MFGRTSLFLALEAAQSAGSSTMPAVATSSGFEAEDWKANYEWVGGINEVMRLVFERLLPCRGGGPAREEEEEAVACWVVERSRV